jgi:hypothetical protein
MRTVITGAFVSLDGVMQAPGGPEEDPTRGFKFAPGLSSTPWSLASARPEYGSDRTFGHVATAVGRRAELPWAALYRPVATRSGPRAGSALQLSVMRREEVGSLLEDLV